MLTTYTKAKVNEYFSDQPNTLAKIRELSPLIIEDVSFIAGGVMRSVLDESTTDINAKDIDLYFTSKLNFTQFSNVIETSGAYVRGELLSSSGGNINSSTFINKITGVALDLICKEFGLPTHILDTFDFTVCKISLYKQNGEIYMMWHNHALLHLNLKLLVFDSSVTQTSYGIFDRTLRYAKYGFTPDPQIIRVLLGDNKSISSTGQQSDAEASEDALPF
jgi:hypothetical protein